MDNGQWKMDNFGTTMKNLTLQKSLSPNVQSSSDIFIADLPGGLP
jgi:hypothetical protein